jgi:hypothetical protein
MEGGSIPAAPHIGVEAQLERERHPGMVVLVREKGHERAILCREPAHELGILLKSAPRLGFVAPGACEDKLIDSARRALLGAVPSQYRRDIHAPQPLGKIESGSTPRPCAHWGPHRARSRARSRSLARPA